MLRQTARPWSGQHPLEKIVLPCQQTVRKMFPRPLSSTLWMDWWLMGSEIYRHRRLKLLCRPLAVRPKSLEEVVWGEDRFGW